MGLGYSTLLKTSLAALLFGTLLRLDMTTAFTVVVSSILNSVTRMLFTGEGPISDNQFSVEVQHCHKRKALFV